MNTKKKLIKKFLRAKIILYLFSSAVLFYSSYAANATGLILAYSFDEGSGLVALDSSGNNYHGTLVNNPSWISGKYGNAIFFAATDNGNDDDDPRVVIGTGPNVNLPFTIEAWINPVDFADWRAIFSKRDSPASNDRRVDLGLAQATGLVYVAAGNYLSFGYSPPTNVWTHLAVVASSTDTQLYVNGVLLQSIGAITLGTDTSSNVVIGGTGEPAGGDNDPFNGIIDELRIYNRSLTQFEIQSDMNTRIGNGSGLPPDNISPQIAITFPNDNSAVSSIITIMANATDNVGILGVQFLLNGSNLGPEDFSEPYAFSWDTRSVPNGLYVLSARARDASSNINLSGSIIVNVLNTNFFQNEILITGLNLPTNIEFLPDGRMLIGELVGNIWILRPNATAVDSAPFLHISNIGQLNGQQGLMDITLDPNFTSNGYYYVFYTLGSPNVDRVSRFTSNGTGTIPGSEFVVYQDTVTASDEHHGGAINFGADGKLYITTGDHFNAPDSQSLTSYHGKILRVGADGSIPTDNPFYDGAGPNRDEIWALGLRNPFRASIDSVTGRYYIGDVGGNDYSVAKEEVNLGTSGANYEWPNCEGNCGLPGSTNPIYFYPHNGRDASITGGFIYRGVQFPSEYYGNYFFADYTQNWIKRLIFDSNGSVNGVFNFEPIDGSNDGPYGDIVHLTQGPDGALYYTDLGFSDNGNIVGVSKIRRIRYTQTNQAPVSVASFTPISGSAPLTIEFSSNGSFDPDGQMITYFWNFGDGENSTLPNPPHTFQKNGQFTVRLTVFDNLIGSLSNPLIVNIGNVPIPTILSPVNGTSFRAGDAIVFSGEGFDAEDRILNASAFTWNIYFHHNAHIHPKLPQTNTTSSTLFIPSAGHDFSGDTNYEILLTVRDSDGLEKTTSVFVYPQKVNLTFDTFPTGLRFNLDGIARIAPLVFDTLIGFNHSIDAPNQSSGSTIYSFNSWSDSGLQAHNIIVPSFPASYLAVYNISQIIQPSGLMASYGFEETNGTLAMDASGNANTGTLVNGAARAAGKNGIGLSFDGVNDYLSIPNSPTLDISGTSLTVSMWIYPQALSSGDSLVIGKFWNQVDMNSPTYQYGLELTGGGTPDFYIGTNSGLLRSTMAGTLAFNKWTNLAVVFNGTEARFYRNGTLINVNPMAASIQARGNSVNIGADVRPSQFHKGLIDDVRIYNRTLNQSEIQADMNTPVGAVQDKTPPFISNGKPNGTLIFGTTSANLSVATNEAAVCRYSLLPNTPYDSMENAFLVTGGVNHLSGIFGLQNGQAYSYYVRCVDSSNNTNNNDFAITFSIAVPDLQPPSTSITFPTDKTKVAGTLTVNVTAFDNIGISYVELYKDNLFFANDSTPPYQYLWITSDDKNGLHALSARAIDTSGNSANSSVIFINVSNLVDTIAPNLSITLPANGSNVSGIVIVNATASDNVEIAGVQFRVDGTNLGAEDSVAPYSISWDTKSSVNGNHTLMAIARDTSNNKANKTIVVRVANSAAKPGLVSAYGFNEGFGIITGDLAGKNNGNLTNNPTWTSGIYGNAILFSATDNGNDDDDPRVVLGRNLRISIPFTISAWIKPVDYVDWRAIFSKRDSSATNDRRVDIGLSQLTGSIYVSAGNTRTFTYSPPVNTWTHLTVIANSTKTRLYVNGTLRETISSISLGTDNTANAVIGGTGEPAAGDNDPFKGIIDELRIYNRSLTQSEIQNDVITPVG